MLSDKLFGMNITMPAPKSSASVTPEIASPKLCFPCARRKLAGKPPKPCGTCIILNVDPLAKVRAIHAHGRWV